MDFKKMEEIRVALVEVMSRLEIEGAHMVAVVYVAESDDGTPIVGCVGNRSWLAENAAGRLVNATVELLTEAGSLVPEMARTPYRERK